MSDDHGETFGEMLRRQRTTAGLSQEALAVRSGISRDAISMLERGVRRSPRVSTVAQLARALRASAGDRDALVAAALRPAATSQAPPAGVPRELPRALADFTGRGDELARLRELLEPDGAHQAAVVSIGGMGGVGKSALAIQAAHQLAAAFPGGQLYVSLHGATDGLLPLAPRDALARMLRSLGQHPSAVPTEVEEAAARFRSLAASRRLLVLLDNARDADQVRPLLPGSPTCAVLVTSREVLATLEGAQAVHLDVLPAEQALELLGRIAGRERVAAEPGAAAEVVGACGRLPLAIRIAGARLAGRPTWPVRELAGLLSDSTRRLHALRSGGLGVQGCFDVSLGALRESSDHADRAAAATFCLLGLPDGPDIGVPAAARLAGQPEDGARALLERLVDARLLEAPRPGRYQFHDLVRLFARQQADLLHPEPERLAALSRLFGFYLATAWRTQALLRPGDRRMETADARWTAGGLDLADGEAAVDWLETERVNLLAAITQAARCAVAPELPGQLARALFGFFELCGHWHDWEYANQTALEVARRTGDRAAQASALNDLGGACVRLGRHTEAIASLEEGIAIFGELGNRRARAGALVNLGAALAVPRRYAEGVPLQLESLAIYRELGDRQGRAAALGNLGFLLGRLGRNEEAIASLEESAGIYGELGSRLGRAGCLNSLGSAHERLGRDDVAMACHAESLALFRELGARLGEAHCLDSIGGIELRRGCHEEAVARLRECLAVFCELGDDHGQAAALRGLGDALEAAGQDREARAAWEEGLAVCEPLQLAEAAELRERLAGRA